MDTRSLVAPKGSKLYKCINKMYVAFGYKAPNIPNPDTYNKDMIRGILNATILSSKPLTFQESVNRIKRRLFINDKLKLRKSVTPKFKNQTITEMGHFKPMRHIIGIKKIRRDFRNEAQQRILYNLNVDQLNVERSLDDRVYFLNQQHDERNSNYSHQIQNMEYFYHNANEFNGEYNAISHPIQPMWYSCYNPNRLVAVNQINNENYEREQIGVQYYSHNNAHKREEPLRRQDYPPNNNPDNQNEQMEIQHYLHNHDPSMEVEQMEAQYFQRMHANDKVTEASVRSILYIRTLVGIISNEQG